MGERITSPGNNTAIILKSALCCLRYDTCLSSTFGVFNNSYRIASPLDLVLHSLGDLPHSGLYPYAYSRWDLKAPAYSTLPVQAIARIAATEEADGIRDDEDVAMLVAHRSKLCLVTKVMHTSVIPRTLCRIIKWRRIRFHNFTCQN
jgi:hypothetical protein